MGILLLSVQMIIENNLIVFKMITIVIFIISKELLCNTLEIILDLLDVLIEKTYITFPIVIFFVG